MHPDDAVRVSRLDGPAAARAEDLFRLVYAEAFAEPPYRESAADVEAAFRRFRTHTAAPSFRGAPATAADAGPVGIAYGRPLAADTKWWEPLHDRTTDEDRREDGRRTFGLMEPAVRKAHRRRGVARRLHDALLSGTGAERAVLHVHAANTAAVAAYRAWGYEELATTRPWPGAAPHHVLLLPLH
ncbi:GNAT family N-acetyltransferase [Streptomyces sp. NPDC004436]